MQQETLLIIWINIFGGLMLKIMLNYHQNQKLISNLIIKTFLLNRAIILIQPLFKHKRNIVLVIKTNICLINVKSITPWKYNKVQIKLIIQINNHQNIKKLRKIHVIKMVIKNLTSLIQLSKIKIQWRKTNRLKLK